MPASPQDKYAREKARAQALGFASPYERRKARAQQFGYRTPYQRAIYEARNAPDPKRAYARRRELAQQRGFASPYQERRAKALGLSGDILKSWQKEQTLKYFDITESKLNKIRAANRKWAKEYPMLQWSEINTYNMTKDKGSPKWAFSDANTNNWSIRRIGYILSFHGAIVDPSTNYDSLIDEKGKRLYVNGKPKTNVQQFRYLVEYTGIMEIDEFESRYGSMTLTG